jgi:hypothetical protein
MDANITVKEAARAGLCATCVYARVVPHPRGGDAYWRCGKHDEDQSFPKYPRLPVLVCGGYTEVTSGA